MTGIAIYANPSSDNGCVSGFKFIYSDGTAYDAGASLGFMSPVLSISTPGGLTKVDDYHGEIIDILRLCSSSSCVVAGNTGGRTVNTFYTVNSAWTITSFWGSFGSWRNQNCLIGFGVNYY